MAEPPIDQVRCTPFCLSCLPALLLSLFSSPVIERYRGSATRSMFFVPPCLALVASISQFSFRPRRALTSYSPTSAEKPLDRTPLHSSLRLARRHSKFASLGMPRHAFANAIPADTAVDAFQSGDSWNRGYCASSLQSAPSRTLLAQDCDMMRSLLDLWLIFIRSKHPQINEVLKDIHAKRFLDLGCCMGTDLRRYVIHGMMY